MGDARSRSAAIEAADTCVGDVLRRWTTRSYASNDRAADERSRRAGKTHLREAARAGTSSGS